MIDGRMIEIRAFEPRWSQDFARLNIDWLERYFKVEPIDREVLSDPQTHILDHGGRVLMAVDEHDHVVGTVALKREDAGVYELTKMAVDPAQHGRGIGRLLMEAALAEFRAVGGRELFLESSSKLGPALQLYESVGFRHRPAPRPGSKYVRADVYMVWEPGEE